MGKVFSTQVNMHTVWQVSNWLNGCVQSAAEMEATSKCQAATSGVPSGLNLRENSLQCFC